MTRCGRPVAASTAALARDTVHLFSIDLADEQLRLQAREALAEEERAALLAIGGGDPASGDPVGGDPRRRSSRLLARGYLRCVLGGYCGVDPRALPIARDPRGKPFLATTSGRGRLTFNLAHSGARLLIGVARDLEIGIDIEEVRPIGDVMLMAEQHFSAVEAGELAALAPALRLRAFYAGWTRKEAFVKATGAGLAGDFRSFDVTLRPEEPPRITGFRGRWAALRAHEWQVRALAPGADIIAACVARCRSLSCRWMPLAPAADAFDCLAEGA